jgi:hypothetical protein
VSYFEVAQATSYVLRGTYVYACDGMYYSKMPLADVVKAILERIHSEDRRWWDLSVECQEGKRAATKLMYNLRQYDER